MSFVQSLITAGYKHKEIVSILAAYDYSCLMCSLPGGLKEALKKFSYGKIKDDILYLPDKEQDKYGREDEFHITVKYGLKETNPELIRPYLKPVKIKLGPIGKFEQEDYDVLKVDVISKDLETINKTISENFENVDEHPIYEPHITLAYVQKGKGDELVGEEAFKDEEFEIRNFYFTTPNEERFELTAFKAKRDVINEMEIDAYNKGRYMSTEYAIRIFEGDSEDVEEIDHADTLEEAKKQAIRLLDGIENGRAVISEMEWRRYKNKNKWSLDEPDTSDDFDETDIVIIEKVDGEIMERPVGELDAKMAAKIKAEVDIHKLDKLVEEKYPGVQLWTTYHAPSNSLTIDKIIVPKEQRNQGIGTEVMNMVIDFANKHKLTLALTPSSDFGGNKKRLEKWYKGFGFKKNQDFAISEHLSRKPSVVSEQSSYQLWKRKNVTLRGMKERGQENKVYGSFGKGLYTVPLSNREMAKQYGDVYFVVNGIPKNPKIVNTLNDAELLRQNLIIEFCAKHNKDYDRGFFEDNTDMSIEMMKNGFDGLIIKGREMVNYNPQNVLYFKTEDELKNYYESVIKAYFGIPIPDVQSIPPQIIKFFEEAREFIMTRTTAKVSEIKGDDAIYFQIENWKELDVDEKSQIYQAIKSCKFAEFLEDTGKVFLSLQKISAEDNMNIKVGDWVRIKPKDFAEKGHADLTKRKVIKIENGIATLEGADGIKREEKVERLLLARKFNVSKKQYKVGQEVWDKEGELWTIIKVNDDFDNVNNDPPVGTYEAEKFDSGKIETFEHGDLAPKDKPYASLKGDEEIHKGDKVSFRKTSRKSGESYVAHGKVVSEPYFGKVRVKTSDEVVVLDVAQLTKLDASIKSDSYNTETDLATDIIEALENAESDAEDLYGSEAFYAHLSAIQVDENNKIVYVEKVSKVPMSDYIDVYKSPIKFAKNNGWQIKFVNKIPNIEADTYDDARQIFEILTNAPTLQDATEWMKKFRGKYPDDVLDGFLSTIKEYGNPDIDLSFIERRLEGNPKMKGYEYKGDKRPFITDNGEEVEMTVTDNITKKVTKRKLPRYGVWEFGKRGKDKHEVTECSNNLEYLKQKYNVADEDVYRVGEDRFIEENIESKIKALLLEGKTEDEIKEIVGVNWSRKG